MKNKLSKKLLALLLTLAMLAGLLPAAAWAAGTDVSGAIDGALTYYQTRQGGVLEDWQALAAVYAAGGDLTAYSLPATPPSGAGAVFTALIKGDASSAAAAANGLVSGGALRPGGYAYGDALNVLAIESYNRSAPGIPYDKAAAARGLLAARETDGGFGFGDGGDTDTTGLVLAALSLLADQPGVPAATGEALAFLHRVQQPNGGFSSAWSGNNASSAALVLSGLIALGEDIDGDWAKAGHTPADALLTFVQADGGFGSGASDAFSTKQSLLALAEYQNDTSFFVTLTRNPDSYQSVLTQIVGAGGEYTEKNGTFLSPATIADILPDHGNYTYTLSGDSLLAVHKNFTNVAYFKTAPTDSFGVNRNTVAFGGDIELQLLSAAADSWETSAPVDAAQIVVDGVSPYGLTTDAEGRVTLGFLSAGEHTVRASGLAAATAVLPAKITMNLTGAQSVTASLRIEGQRGNILYKPSLTVGNSGGKVLTVLDAVTGALDTAGISYAANGGYLSAIAGEDAALGGGWMYNFTAPEYLNGTRSAGGMETEPIHDGDEILVYYTNAGFSTAIPLVTTALNPDKSVTVTVQAWATSYDALWNPSTALVAVEGATVLWSRYTTQELTGATDANGSFTIPPGKAGVGSHGLQIEKDSGSGPDLVRLPPGYTVTISNSGTSSSAPQGVSDKVFITVTGYSGTLRARTALNWYAGITPLAALQQSGLAYDAGGGYVKSIAGLAEFDRGPNSGWLYQVNGVETIRDSASAYQLGAGDELVWFYTGDYTQEKGSASWTGGGGTGGAAAVGTQTVPGSVIDQIPAQLTEAGGGVTATTAVDGKTLQTAAREAQKTLDAAKKADPNAQLVGEVRIQIAPEAAPGGETPPEITEAALTLPAAAVRELGAAQNLVLTAASGLGTLTLDSATLTGLVSGAGNGETVKIVVAAADKNEALTPRQREASGGKPVVSVEVYVGATRVENFSGSVTVFVPYTPPATLDAGDYDLLTVYSLSPDGAAGEIPGAAYDPTAGVLRFPAGQPGAFLLTAWISPFADVEPGAWYYKAVRYGVDSALILGTGDARFSPDTKLSRAMLMTLLARMAEVDTAGGPVWYSRAVDWATERGISDGTNPEGDISREQLVTMLHRFAGSPPGAADLSQYTDAAQLAGFSRAAAEWAVAKGLLAGTTETTLSPKATATRAEVTVLLQRFARG